MSMKSAGTVRLDSSARFIIEEHAFSRLDVEVGGFLVGRIDGPATEIVSAKPALTAESNQTHLTITHEAWAEILEVMDSEFPGLAIIGWYHTHPGFGLFLSDYDIFIQQNFFGARGQIAMVIDPLIGEFGYFIAKDDKATRIDGGTTDLPAVAAPGIERADLLSATRGRATGTTGASWKAPVVAAAVTAVVVGAGAWFVGTIQGQESERAIASAELSAAGAQVSQLAGLLASQDPGAPATLTPMPAPSSNAGAADSSPGLVLQSGDPVAVVIEYTVRDGESWWSIAKRLYGEGNRFRELQEENSDVASLNPGLQLRIPQRGLIQTDATVVTP